MSSGCFFAHAGLGERKLAILRFERASKTVFLHLDWRQSLNKDGEPVHPRGAVETWTFRGSELVRELFSTLAARLRAQKTYLSREVCDFCSESGTGTTSRSTTRFGAGKTENTSCDQTVQGLALGGPPALPINQCRNQPNQLNQPHP
jgi:hypothetical protein